MTRVIASIEARMGSTRLPGKVLSDIGGQPALTRLLRRIRRCRTLDGIILATSDAVSDDPLANWAAHEGVPLSRKRRGRTAPGRGGAAQNGIGCRRGNHRGLYSA